MTTSNTSRNIHIYTRPCGTHKKAIPCAIQCVSLESRSHPMTMTKDTLLSLSISLPLSRPIEYTRIIHKTQAHPYTETGYITTVYIHVCSVHTQYDDYVTHSSYCKLNISTSRIVTPNQGPPVFVHLFYSSVWLSYRSHCKLKGNSNGTFHSTDERARYQKGDHLLFLGMIFMQ